MALACSRLNRISTLMDGGVRLYKKEDIITHVQEFFSSHYSKKGMVRSLLNKLEFASIVDENACWLERAFEEDEVRAAVVFDLGRDKAPRPDGFPYGLLPIFLE